MIIVEHLQHWYDKTMQMLVILEHTGSNLFMHSTVAFLQ